MIVIEVRRCGCGRDTFLGDGVCYECRELEEALRAEITAAYRVMVCNMEAARRFLGKDLREGLAERLVKP